MTSITNKPIVTIEQIAAYRRDGFTCVRNIISKEEVEKFCKESLKITRYAGNFNDRSVFTQRVNAWRESPVLKKLTLHPRITYVAKLLAGVPLRLWHDHVLIKQPHNNTPTHFHQDKPYWPHDNSPNPLSCWVALCDVPAQRGCMSFIPGSQELADVPTQNLEDPNDLYNKAPDLQYQPRVTLPLRAGDCTFHHGLCAHMANPNDTDEPRVAMAIIYMDAGATYSNKKHVVTDPLDIKPGATLDGEMFPQI